MVAYKLLLLENSKIYHVFHISLLKKQVSETAFNSTELPPLEDDGFIMMEPESILNTRWVKHGSKFFEKNKLNGDIYLRRTPCGKRLLSFMTNSLTLRTRF